MPFKQHPTKPDMVIYEPNVYWIPKPWVGLTKEEQCQIAIECGAMSDDWLDFVVEIEAKLKEKNT